MNQKRLAEITEIAFDVFDFSGEFLDLLAENSAFLFKLKNFFLFGFQVGQ